MDKRMFVLIVLVCIVFLNTGCEKRIYGYEETYAYRVCKQSRFADEYEFRQYLRRYSELYKKSANATARVDSQAAIVSPSVAGLLSASTPPPGFTNLSAGLLSFFFWSGTKTYDFQYPQVFIWKEGHGDQTAEEVNSWLIANYLEVVRKEVGERGLFQGFDPQASKEEIGEGFTPLVYKLGMNGTMQNYCQIGVSSREDKFPQKKVAPEILGKEKLWEGSASIGGWCYYRQPTTFFNSYVKKPVPFHFATYDFWVSLSKKLPTEFFIYLPPAGKFYSCKYENGEKLMHPVVLHQGQPHWFYPGAS